jgi:hypothetical protein
MSYSITAVAEAIGAPVEPEGPGLEPETFLPEQFFSEIRSQASGERLLLIALLQDAINCFRNYLFATKARNRRLFREAERWIMETDPPPQDENMHPYFTFEQTCCFLGLDPDYVRDKLLRWRRQQLTAADQPTSPAQGGRLRRPPSSDHDRRVRPALVSCYRMGGGQNDAVKSSDAARARRLQRIAS